MAYEIVIKETTREQVQDRHYTVVGKDDDGKNQYGYVEEESTKDVSREVYTQRVEDLDIVEVIKAINGLRSK